MMGREVRDDAARSDRPGRSASRRPPHGSPCRTHHPRRRCRVGAGADDHHARGVPAALLAADVHARSRWSSAPAPTDRKSTRLNSSHTVISYAVFCLKKKAGCPPTEIFSASFAASSSVTGRTPTCPRQRVTFAAAPPAAPPSGISLTSADFTFLEISKLATRICVGSFSFQPSGKAYFNAGNLLLSGAGNPAGIVAGIVAGAGDDAAVSAFST